MAWPGAAWAVVFTGALGVDEGTEIIDVVELAPTPFAVTATTEKE